MIGSFLTRALALVFGYAYPAYECFKTVEMNRQEIEQLRFWCQYWILVAALTVFERVGDTFISWMPMYSEAKVAFFVYLWHPKTRGTTYIYENFLQPYVASHETDIDRNLLELKARAGDMVFLYWKKAANFGQSRFLEIFQYIASQAPHQQTSSRPTMQRQPAHLSLQAPAPASVGVQAAASPPADNQAATVQKPVRIPPLTPVKSKNQEPTKSAADAPAAPPAQTQPSSGIPAQPTSSVAASQPSTSEGEVKKIDAAETMIAAEVSNPATQDTPMDEAIRMTRGRLRKRAIPFGQSTR